MRRVYLDHAATTPVHPEVAELVKKFMVDIFGNPSSAHKWGRRANEGMVRAREQVARLINARPEEIIFTGGGTEADNLAIKGTAEVFHGDKNHIITSAIEHHAILHACEWLEEERGFEITYLPVDEYGQVDPTDVREAITENTFLVSIMRANNEVGTLQPIEEIAAIARDRGVAVHTDAVQAVGQLPVDVKELGVDMLTLSGHKLYGPKGVGALYVRDGHKLKPIIHGGAHEWRLRAGTENMPGIVGLGKAAELADKELSERADHLRTLQQRLMEGLLERINDVYLNGHPEQRLPNNVNIAFKYIEGESLLLNLDQLGIAVSTGSACTSGTLKPSHVLLAMGLAREDAQGSVRMTLGAGNSAEDIDYVLDQLPRIVENLRAMSPLNEQSDSEERENG
jgi:cysteine desulfurase